MAEFIDNAYKTGAGRYIQEAEAINSLAEEVERYGKKPFIVCGPNSRSVALPLIEKALNTKFQYEIEEYAEPVCYEGIEQLANIAKSKSCDVVLGVGGGRIIDTSKGVAATLSVPIIAIPTSIATCSAYTPLSVMYHEDGSFRDTWRYVKEIDAVVVDGRVMATQPPRLIAAGVLDAMAKVPELLHGTTEMNEDDGNIQRFTAYKYAAVNYDLLKKYGTKAFDDAKKGNVTSDLGNVAFLNLALTGVVSAIMRGYHQTALAHRFYDGLRSVFTEEVRQYLHGELVAIGLLLQTEYNENPSQKEEILAMMERMEMPCSLSDLGISKDDERIDDFYKYINIEEFVAKDDKSQTKLKRAFKTTF